nr:unnamed protein product [Callosobruchus chinensis]
MLRDSTTAILENLSSSDLREYSKMISALKLRFRDAHLPELLHGQPDTASQGGFDYACLRSFRLSGRPVCHVQGFN